MRCNDRGRFIICLIIAFCSLFSGATAVESVVINEACGSNKTVIQDEYGAYPDYIELYNPTGADIDLSGCALADDGGSCVLPDSVLCVIPRRGYRVIFFSGAAGGEADLHVPLKLSAGAPETISLYSPDGALIDSIDMPAMGSDEAFSRQSDGQYAKTGGTPGAVNEIGQPYVPEPLVLKPVLSRASGFYDEPFLLDIQYPKGSTVYYTLDSSDPTIDDTPFTGPISVTDPSGKPNVYSAISNITTGEYTPPVNPVDKAFVVRAVAVDARGNASKTATGVYFIGFQDKPQYKDMSIVSLVTDPDNLFNDDTGIYVLGNQYAEWVESGTADSSINQSNTPANYNSSGRAWEREAEMTYIDRNGKLCMSQPVGIRIHGNYTRTNAQKSFNIYTRKAYGSGAFDYEFFRGANSNSIVLRNGGNDTLTKMRDALGQSLFAGMDLATQGYIPCVLFLDGEYWGFYFIRERLSEDFIAGRFGVDADSVAIMKNNQLEAGAPGDYNDYRALERFAYRNDLSIEENYETISEQIDIDNFIQYICIEVFLANGDWMTNNTGFWRAKAPASAPFADGKWRSILLDLDLTFDSFDTRHKNNTYERALNSTIFKALIKNEEFYNRFLVILADIVNDQLRLERVTEFTDELWRRIKRQIVLSNQRFGQNYTTGNYSTGVTGIINFVKRRMNYLSNFVAPDRSLIKLTIEENLPGAANWHLNTIRPELTKGSWTGQYFTGSVMDVSAEPREGYLFDHWEVNGQEFSSQQRLIYPLDEPATLRAVFTAQDKICRWEDSTDAVSTGFYETASLEPVGSTNVKALGDGEFSLASDEGWAAGDGVEMTLCTAGCDRITFSAKLCGDRRAPRDYALYYSTDGETFTRVEGGGIRAYDEDDEAPSVHIALPGQCSDQYKLYVRLLIESGYCVNGKKTLFGATKGAGVLSDLAFRSCASDMTYAYYDEAIRRCERLASDYPAVAEALRNTGLPESLTQHDLDEKTRALLTKAGAAMLEAGVITLEEFDRRYGVGDQLYVDMCANAPVYTVTSDIVRFSQDEIIETIDYYPNDSFLYKYEDGAFVFEGIMKSDESDLVYFPMSEGAYLWLESPIEQYQYSCELLPVTEGVDLPLSELGGSVPSGAALFTVKAVEAFDGHCVVPFAAWSGGREVYAYQISDGAVVSSSVWEYLKGELITQKARTGDYLLLTDSIDEYARQNQDLEAMREKMAKRKNEEQSKTSKDLIALAAVIIVALSALVIAILLIRRALNKKKKKTEG